MAARSPRRTLLALSAFLVLAIALAWVLGRRPGPEVASRPPQAVAGSTTPLPAEAAPAIPEPDSSGIPHTKLPLRLLGTVVSEKPDRSLATVEDVERSLHEVMRQGQPFEGRPEVRIAAIERARILIDNDGVREQLAIVHRVPEAAAVTPEEREHRRDVSRRLRALTDAGTSYRDLLGRGQREGLLAEGNVSAVYEDGEMVGVQVDDIRDGGFYDQLGLRNGDVVTEINGVSLADPAAAAKVIEEFVGAPQLSIAVERGADGAPETLVVDTPPLRSTVGALEPPPPE